MGRPFSIALAVTASPWVGQAQQWLANPEATSNLVAGLQANLPGFKQDLNRYWLGRSITAMSAGRFLEAGAALKKIPSLPEAAALSQKMEGRKNEERSLRIAVILQALISDFAELENYPNQDKALLLDIASKVAQLYNHPTPPDSLSKAFASIESSLTAHERSVWNSWVHASTNAVSQLSNLVGSKGASSNTQDLLRTAYHYRSQGLGFSAWVLAKMAQADPASREAAQAILDTLENQRFSLEYLLGRIGSQGGASLTFNALALLPGLWFGRWIARRSAFNSIVSNPLRVFSREISSIAGGSLVGYSTELGLLWASGFDGDYLPNSLQRFLRDWGIFALELGVARRLSARFWRHAERELSQLRVWLRRAFTPVRFFALGLVYIPVSLLSQAPAHLADWRSMTRVGEPRRLFTLFPSINNATREVNQRFAGARYYQNFQSNARNLLTAEPGTAPEKDLAYLLGELDPTLLEPELKTKKMMALAELYRATAGGHFNTNVKRWLQSYLTSAAEDKYDQANQLLSNNKVDLQFLPNGKLCFPQSWFYSCVTVAGE